MKASRVETLHHILNLAHHFGKGSADAHGITAVSIR